MPPKKKAVDESSIPNKKPKTSPGKGKGTTTKSAKTGKGKQKKESNNAAPCHLKPFLKDSDWLTALDGEFEKEYFKKIEKNLGELQAKKVVIHPPMEEIFNAFNWTPFDKVKVVILGQDPYHDDDQAHGLSFSVPRGKKVPPSLRNIFKELSRDIPGFTVPDHGYLESWARQGVFLLNAALTVVEHEPNSHGGKKFGWQTFTDQVIKCISEGSNNVVFILWGNFAHKKAELVDDKKHHVIKTAHPSPLSFNKFSGCGCFSETNKALKKFGQKEIDWSL